MENIINIVSTTLPLLLVPGANNIVLMNAGARFGFWSCTPHILGSVFGFVFILVACFLGLSGLIANYPLILVLVKWFGASWLLILSWRFISSHRRQNNSTEENHIAPFSFLKAMIFMFSNPGAMTLALIVFSLSIDDSFYLACATTWAVGLFATVLWTLNGQLLAPLFDSDRFGKTVKQSLGVIIGFSAIRLVLL